MGFNTDADKFWRILTWTTIIGLFVGGCWWAYSTRTPDLPFNAWLMTASRDDVWRACFGCVAAGVAFGRIITRK
jgi:hypothetical protein